MMNDRLKRVQIGRDKDVPIETNSKLWFLWTRKDGSWDAENINGNLITALDSDDVEAIFCVWHGEWSTNLFLMNKKDLLDRLKKLRH